MPDVPEPLKESVEKPSVGRGNSPASRAALVPGVKAPRGEDGKLIPKAARVLSNEKHEIKDVIEWVILHDEREDFTNEQRFYRSIKDRNPEAFAKMRDTLKRSAEAEVEAARVAAAPAVVEDELGEAPFPELEEGWAEYQEWLRVRRSPTAWASYQEWASR